MIPRQGHARQQRPGGPAGSLAVHARGPTSRNGRWPRKGSIGLLLRVAREYRPGFMYVTENGTSLPDAPGPGRSVHDPVRTRYVARHAAAVRQAIADGADVRGYFVWSFMDNFEWGFGFTKRFGITHVDYKTQKRTVKESGRWYAKVVRENGFPLADAAAPD